VFWSLSRLNFVQRTEHQQQVQLPRRRDQRLQVFGNIQGKPVSGAARSIMTGHVPIHWRKILAGASRSPVSEARGSATVLCTRPRQVLQYQRPGHVYRFAGKKDPQSRSFRASAAASASEARGCELVCFVHIRISRGYIWCQVSTGKVLGGRS
jgi:hypothetical protein